MMKGVYHTSIIKHFTVCKTSESETIPVWPGPAWIWRHACFWRAFMSVYTHLSPQPDFSIAQGSELCLGLLFPPSLCKMLDHQRLNALVTQCTGILEPKPISLRQVPDGTDLNLNHLWAALKHSWIIWLLPELDTRLILWGDTARSQVRFLLSLFRLKQETEGPTLAFGPGVLLRMEGLGVAGFVAGFPPEMPTGLEAESCGEKREDVRPGHAFHSHTTTSWWW